MEDEGDIDEDNEKERKIFTSSKMSKLYYHAMTHSFLFLRKITPKITEMQEGTWIKDRQDFLHVSKKNIHKVLVWKTAIKNYFSDKYQSHSTYTKSPFNSKLKDEINIPKSMIYKDNGEIKDQFKYLLKLLGDIKPENLVYNDDGTYTFVCKDTPEIGPDDMIFGFYLKPKFLRR